MRTLVIIPAYNEQSSIVSVVRRLKAVEPSIDYLVINDGSTDNTGDCLESHRLAYVKHPANMGIGVTMQTGYMYAQKAGYDIAVQLDGDGQHNPEYIRELIAPIIKGEADLVIGSRFLGANMGYQSSLMRRVGIGILRMTVRLFAGVNIKDVTSGFRACGRPLIDYFAVHYAEDYPEPEAIMAAHLKGFRLKEVPVIMNERAMGESSIRGFQSLYYMIKVMLVIIIHSIRFRSGRRRRNGG